MSPRSHRSKLPSSKEIEAALRKDGFTPRKSSGGSHRAYIRRNPGILTRVVVVPLNREEMPEGTFSSILRQAGWTREYFENLL
jgi:predicted RNA binding protein YcfA (HicA-like mRNA interferase family)